MSDRASARRMLLPLAPAYRLALVLRELRLRAGLEPVRKLRWPVVSAGSLSAGGAGKTPLTIALAKALSACGFSVDVLSRGYGRQSREPARVQPDRTAEEFGDEPFLIAQQAGVPVYVAAQRYDAGVLAEADRQNEKEQPRRPIQFGEPVAPEWPVPPERQVLHLLDDGFQHRQLARDIDILLVNRSDWHDHLLPAGDLREPRSAARRASVIAIPADEPEFERELRDWGWQGPIWRVRRKMEIPSISGPVAAFCGIARSSQFFRGLESAGIEIAARRAFADHHRFTSRDLERVIADARTAGATSAITTEKDRVRMGKLASLFPAPLPLLAAGLRIELNHEAIGWLARRVSEIAKV
jgi:tetraacyldisaccharide 4'-kinase